MHHREAFLSAEHASEEERDFRMTASKRFRIYNPTSDWPPFHCICFSSSEVGTLQTFLQQTLSWTDMHVLVDFSEQILSWMDLPGPLGSVLKEFSCARGRPN